MKMRNIKNIFIVILLVVIFIGTGILGASSVEANTTSRYLPDVIGSGNNMMLTNNAIDNPYGDSFVGDFYPVSGKCTDQDIFTLNSSGTDNYHFTINNSDSSYFLAYTSPDPDRDIFTIGVRLECVLESQQVTYEDEFTIYVASDMDLDPNKTITLGDPFSYLGFFTDPGPENSWTLYVNYGDSGGEYESGWVLWDFDTYARAYELYHVYAQEGVYNVGVRAVDDRGFISEAFMNLTVNHSPVASAGGPYNILEHGDVLLDASGSIDSQHEIVSYEWDLDNDGSFDDASGVTVATFYADDTGGPFVIKVKVTNTEGQSDTAWAYVYVANVAPSLSTHVGGTIDEGQMLISSWSFTDPGYDTWTATVDYGDNSGVLNVSLVGKSVPLNHMYEDNGIYTVTVSVQDDDGGQDTGTFSVIVNDTVPSIDTLVASSQTINEGGSVSFSATYSNPNPYDTHTIEWDFGDGNSAAGFLTPTNDYLDNNGTSHYTAVLRITDDDGNVAIKTINITVNNVTPVVSAITGSSTAETGTEVSFNATFSDQGILDLHSATWFWGDGSTESGVVFESSGTVIGTHTYTAAGNYTIYLQIQDNDGDSGQSPNFYINVEDPFVPPTPIVYFSGEYSMPEGSTFTNVGGFSDPLSESWTATVDYGDGIGEQTLQLNSDHTFSVEHDYEDNGQYIITVRVTNNYGMVGSATYTVNVYNVAPFFTWEYSITTNAIYTMQERIFFTSANSVINLSATNIYDPSPVDVFTYTWNFGDGTTATGQSVSHTWTNLNLYTITLTIYDDDGGWCQDYIYMDIRNMTPAVQIGGIGNYHTYYNEGDNIQEAGFFVDINTYSTWTGMVDYGDGSGSQALILNPDKTFILNHIYADEGVFTAIVTVQDQFGASGSDEMQVHVSNISPIVEAGSNFTINTGQTFSGAGFFTDPGADSWNGIVNYGDGSILQGLTLNNDQTFSFSHAYAAEGIYTVSITINDGDGGTGSDSMIVNVDDSLQVDEFMTLNGMILTPGGFGLPCDYFGICTGGLEFRLPAGVADNDLFTINNFFNSEHPELSYAELVFIGPTDPNRTEYNISVELICTKVDGITETWLGNFSINIESLQTIPLVNAGTDTSIDEGETFTTTGSFLDPDSSSWIATINYGDGSGEHSLPLGIDNTFNLNHIYSDDGQYVVIVTIQDGEGNTGASSLVVTVNNLAPVITGITFDQANLQEGDLVDFSANVTDAGNDTLTYIWDFGDGLTDSGQVVSHQYLDNGQYSLVLTVTDDEGASTMKSVSVDVLNVAPTVEAGSNFTINTGQTFSGAGFFTDPGADSWNGIVNYGDGSILQGLTLNNDQTFSFGHAYAAEGIYTVSITINDGDGGTGSDSMIVNVDDSLQVDEFMTLNGMILTPGGFGLPCDYFGICTGGLEFRLPAGVVDNDLFTIKNFFNSEQPELSYAELVFVGPANPNRIEYTIYVELVCTKANNESETYIGNFTITIQFENTPPDIVSLNASFDPIEVYSLTNVSAEYIDPDPGDTHTALWDWGDGTTSDGLIQDGIITGSHSYSTAGVFILTLEVKDYYGAVDTESFQYLVIYDPSSGFVTGGGWIDSPPGAYTLNPDLSGKATFGFVAKYKKGANLPTGNTEFQFKVGNLNFRSIAYDWLVIAGNKAIFKGEGSINGQGVYGFMITAIDSSLDRFRIKIWEIDSESIIYDNPLMSIEGGSIVIHN